MTRKLSSNNSKDDFASDTVAAALPMIIHSEHLKAIITDDSYTHHFPLNVTQDSHRYYLASR